MEEFKRYLITEEKSEKTVEKYIRDLNRFKKYVAESVGDGALDIPKKETLIAYKNYLAENYSLVSVNSMLASLNSYLSFIGRADLKVKQFKIQKKTYRSEEKELTKAEYKRLIKTAKENKRLDLIIRTICGTGIRVSELKYIDADSVRQGEFVVTCKNKTRTVFIVKELQKKLLKYIQDNDIKETVFVTKTGRPVDRISIWRDMKKLCRKAEVNPAKVFPHNLRHLFARTFYGIEKDIAKLADILGHSSIDTTRIYIITTGAEHRRRMENMHLVM